MHGWVRNTCNTLRQLHIPWVLQKNLSKFSCFCQILGNSFPAGMPVRELLFTRMDEVYCPINLFIHISIPEEQSQYNIYGHIEIYLLRGTSSWVAEAEKSHGLPSASWRFRKPGDMFLANIWRLRTRGTNGESPSLSLKTQESGSPWGQDKVDIPAQAEPVN